ncbi:hypothetical protein [Maribacter ulvicola]|uniref:DinB family protein n=1 Tax=Maribacter ulvicola TaxID=228959 RepID=A0A1N6X8J9_9FLAO|nr:hypothetical protein [Maribacter ulvicola]SIQ98646.1 hypothetical protein SAMN05421797_10529 [Maribacter ulvicola]
MELQTGLKTIFNSLEEVLLQLKKHEYQHPLNILSNASIGQHTRHIIELFLELEKGYLKGQVNYDLRQRDLELESNIDYCLNKIQEVKVGLGKCDKDLSLVYDCGSGLIIMKTNYKREFIYNVEHMVHHEALIRIGLSNFKHVNIPETFGVAYSTQKFRRKCAR